jgi:GTP-binding protein
VDLPEARAAGERWQKVMARRKRPVPVHLLSAATNQGLDGLLDAVAAVLWEDVARGKSGRKKKLGKPRSRR